jgi:hypothetical protein
MKTLSLIEKNAVTVLERLEYMFDTEELHLAHSQPKGMVRYIIPTSILDHAGIGGFDRIKVSGKYLADKGMLLHIEDFSTIAMNAYEFDPENHPGEYLAFYGHIEGKNKKAIREQILMLKNQILGEDTKNIPITITFYTKEDYFEIGNVRVQVSKGDIERSIVNLLIDKGGEISWDIIMNYHEPDTDYPTGTPYQDNKAKKQLGDSRAGLNNKIITKTALKEDLIARRKNHYSFTREVTKK